MSRLVGFGLWVVLLSATLLWLQRHHGVQYADPGTLGTFVGLLFVVWPGLLKVVKKIDAALVRRWSTYVCKLRPLLYALLAPRTPLLLFLGAFIYATTHSSIALVGVPEARPDLARFSLATLDGSPLAYSCSERGRVCRAFLSVSPYGREVTLKIPGFVPKVLVVGPWWGAKVDVARDLFPVPSVLIRPSKKRIRQGGQTKLIVSRVFSSRQACKGGFSLSEAEFACPMAELLEPRTSILIGLRREIPWELVPSWSLDLQARAEQDEHSQLRVNTLSAWRSPQFVETREVLFPGMRLHAALCGPRDDGRHMLESVEISVTLRAFTDVALLPSAEEERCPPAS